MLLMLKPVLAYDSWFRLRSRTVKPSCEPLYEAKYPIVQHGYVGVIDRRDRKAMSLISVPFTL